jgi:hypothetical protein
MKKSGRTKRRHMRGGLPDWMLGEEKKCIKDNQSLIRLKKYIKHEWPKVTYGGVKRSFINFDDADAEKLRTKFILYTRIVFDENLRLGEFNPHTRYREPKRDPKDFKFKDANYEQLIEGLTSIKPKSDCNDGVALYYLTIVKVLKDTYLINGLEPPPPPHNVPGWIYAQDAQQRRSTAAEAAAEAEVKAAAEAEVKAAAEAAAEIINNLKAAGFTDSELKAAGFTADELKDAGFTESDLKEAGFTDNDDE